MPKTVFLIHVSLKTVVEPKSTGLTFTFRLWPFHSKSLHFPNKNHTCVTCTNKTGMMSAALFLRKLKLRKLGEIVKRFQAYFLKMGVDSCFSKIT
jgi:hypothetical protein